MRWGFVLLMASKQLRFGQYHGDRYRNAH